MCSICFDDPSNAEAGFSCTECGHVFHTVCIEKWYNISSSCAHCRKPVDKKSLRRIYLDHPRNENAIAVKNELVHIVIDDQLNVVIHPPASGSRQPPKDDSVVVLSMGDPVNYRNVQADSSAPRRTVLRADPSPVPSRAALANQAQVVRRTTSLASRPQATPAVTARRRPTVESIDLRPPWRR